MEKRLQISVSRESLADFCRQFRIRKLSFFGSVITPRFGPGSDIDVLVEFEPGAVIGLRLIEIQEKLSAFFGNRKVDLVTPKFISPRMRERVLSEALLQYEG